MASCWVLYSLWKLTVGRWGRERSKRLIDQLNTDNPSHTCYESVEIRGQNELIPNKFEHYEVKVGGFVYYQYDDDNGTDEEEVLMTVACVLLLYSGEDI